jgi:hypothetical protein
MPSQTQAQSKLAKLRRLNASQQCTYSVMGFIQSKDSEVTEPRVLYLETTDMYTMRRYQRFIRRAIKCRRYKVVRPL